MEIITSVFEASHGKRPRGYGSWAFSLSKYPAPEQIFWFTGPYRAAAAAARFEFKGVAVTIYVQP